MLSLKRFGKSLRYAGRGLVEVFMREHSFRVHVLALIIIVAAIMILGIRGTDAALLVVVTTLVLVLELVNSIFERFIDVIEPKVGAHVRDFKDIMAGAVLVTALGALVVGLIIIIPYLQHGRT